MRPHRQQPSRLPRPWDSPGKNNGVGCHFLLQCMKVKSEKWKWSRSIVSDPQRPHGLQPSRLLHPWDFPGKSTGVGCHCRLHTENIAIFILFKVYFFCVPCITSFLQILFFIYLFCLSFMLKVLFICLKWPVVHHSHLLVVAWSWPKASEHWHFWLMALLVQSDDYPAFRLKILTCQSL